MDDERFIPYISMLSYELIEKTKLYRPINSSSCRLPCTLYHNGQLFPSYHVKVEDLIEHGWNIFISVCYIFYRTKSVVDKEKI